MQRKMAFLVFSLTALLGFEHAFAKPLDNKSHEDGAHFKDEPGHFSMRSHDERFSLGIGGHLQTLGEYEYKDKNDNKKHSFDLKINRARLNLHGTAFHPRFSYFLQTQFEKEEQMGLGRIDREGQKPVKGTEHLLDYYLDVAFKPDHCHLRVGKFRTGFSRQQIFSTSRMQFVDNPDANDHFKLSYEGRDIGVMAHGGFMRPVEWSLGVVSNGLVARLGYNYGHIDGYEPVDVRGGDFRFGVAGNGYVHTDYKNTDFKDLRAALDFIAKYKFVSSNGALYYRKNDKKDEYGAEIDGGYLINKRFEPVLRYSFYKTKDSMHEVKGGLNYYPYGHNLKLQGYIGANLANKDMDKFVTGVQLQFAL